MEQFLISALNNYNIELPDKTIETTGFTRWGHNNRYWLLPVGNGYAFGDWSQNINEFVFSGNIDTLSSAERMHVHELIQEERKHRQEEILAQQDVVAQTVQRQFDNCVSATLDFPYLVSKCIQPHCAKQNPDTGTLVIPLYDVDGVLWSVQYIAPDGAKRFASGGRKRGCFCPIGMLTDTIYLCEGFATAATVFEATGKYTVAAMDAGNLRHVAGALRQKYPMAQIIIAADNDWEKETNTGVESANAAAQEWGLSVIVPQITDSGLTDFNDIAVRYGIDMVREQLCPTDCLELKARDYGFKIYSAGDFLAHPLPPTEFLLYPLIPQNGVSMIYAERGAGKTFMGLAIACAMAGGFDFLNFKAEKPRKVLYVDGEMDAREMQDRLNALIAGFAQENKHVIKSNLRLFLAGLQSDIPMPDLATKQGQAKLDAQIADSEVVIVDNIFSLYTAGRENDADSWVEYNSWSRKLRSRGQSVLWLHHTGKDATRGPRGSSALEAILNVSVALEVLPEHRAADGAVALLKYTKTRGVAGDAVKECVVRLITTKDNAGNNIGLRWILTDSPQEIRQKRELEMYAQGNTIEEISETLNVSKSLVGRIVRGIKKAKGGVAKE